MFPYTDDINLIATRHVETVVLLNNLNSREKNHVSVDVDMDEYRRIKDK